MRNVLAHGPFGGLTSSADRSRRSGGAEGGWSAPLMRRMRMAGMLEAAAIVSTQPDKAHGSEKNRVPARLNWIAQKLGANAEGREGRQNGR